VVEKYVKILLGKPSENGAYLEIILKFKIKERL
jgi:hypothetical protein